MGRKAKNELGALARAARAQIARATKLGESIDARMKMASEASPVWTPTEDFRRDFAAITNTLQHAGNAMTRALEGNKKNTDGLSEAQLEAQFKAEIVRSAQTMTDEEWALMCAAREKSNAR